MQPVVYNNLMKYLLFRGSSLQNAFFWGVAYSFLIYYYCVFFWFLHCKMYVWQLLFFFISCDLERKWAESNNNVLKYMTVEGKRQDVFDVTACRQTFFFFKTFEIVKLVVVVLAKAVCAWTPTSSVDSLRGAGLRSSPENQIPLRTASC